MLRALVLAAVAAAALACGQPDADAPASRGGDGGAGPALQGKVLISAAASLRDAFSEIALAFEAANAGVDVVLNLASSSLLRAQILEGAPVDVFASADISNMDAVVAAGGVAGEARIFARNALRIAVPKGNPAGVRGLGDFARPELLLGLCAPEVPCGAFAGRALARAGVVASVDTYEPDVRALLTRIELGELDAGITYVTEVVARRGRVEGIEIPEEHNVVAEYPIAVLAGAPNPDAAAAFVAFVLSDEGQAILRKHGFAAP